MALLWQQQQGVSLIILPVALQSFTNKKKYTMKSNQNIASEMTIDGATGLLSNTFST